MARDFRSDLPPIVASWPAGNVWILVTGTVHSGLPGRPGSRVSIALPPRHKTNAVLAEIAEGIDPETLAFGRQTTTTSKFHAHFKTALTDIQRISVVPFSGATVSNVLVVELRQGGVIYVSLVGLSAAAIGLVELQLGEIWTHATEGLRHWQQRYGPNGLQEVSPTEFERIVAHVFETSGAKVIHTGQTGDGGVDVEVQGSAGLSVVQCKRFRSAVGPGPVRELLGVVKARGAVHGYLVSTNGFTSGAKRFADENRLTLLDSHQLAALANVLASSNGSSGLPGAGGPSIAKHMWPLPEALGPWVSLSTSSTTPRFAMEQPKSLFRLLLDGLGTALAMMIPASLVLWLLALWAAIPFPVLFAPGLAIALVFATKSAHDEDARRTPSCSSCRHQSASHRLEPFSPYRLRLRCRDCRTCDNVLPDAPADSAEQVRPLLYLMPPSAGVVRIERTDGRTSTLVVNMAVQRFPSPILLTDFSGARGVSRYRFHFTAAVPAPTRAGSLPTRPIPPQQPASATVSTTVAPEQRCPKCRKRLRLSRHWEDGRGYWACWTCGFSRELGDEASNA